MQSSLSSFLVSFTLRDLDFEYTGKKQEEIWLNLNFFPQVCYMNFGQDNLSHTLSHRGLIVVI